MLPQTSEYALRVLAVLAGSSGKHLSGAALAAATSTPRHYASKVLRKLAAAGLLVVRHGPGGGFLLARAPRSIRFSDVLRAVDGELTDRRCGFGHAECSSDDPCPLHPTWADLRSRLEHWANAATLADVLPRHDRGRS